MAPPENSDLPIYFIKDLNSNEVESDPVKNVHTVDEALSKIGFGRIQIFMIIMGAIMLFGINNESMGMMMLVTPSQCDLNLTTIQKGFVGASTYFGIMVPSFIWGYLSDAYGRRKVMIYTLLLASFFSISSSFAPSFLIYVLLRFLTGFLMMMLVTASQCDLKLSILQKGLVGASTYFGVTIPSFLWGYLSDLYGRRKIMIYSLILTSISSLCSSFAPTFLSYAFFRFMAGFFVCAASGTLYPYLGEFNPVELRTTVIAFCSVAIGLSMVLFPAISWLILSLDFNIELWAGFHYRPWRLLALVFNMPVLLSAILLMWFPESPKYFITMGQKKEALKTLQWVYTKNTGNHVDTFEVKEIQQGDGDLRTVSKNRTGCLGAMKTILSQIRPLFKVPYVFYLAITCYMQLSTYLASGGMGLWFNYLSNQISKSTSNGTLCDILRGGIMIKQSASFNGTTSLTEDDAVCDDTISEKAFQESIMIGFYYSIILSLIAILVQKIGRGYILMFTFFTASIAGYLLQWVTNPAIAIVLFSFLLVLPGSSLSLVTGSSVNLFPTSVRTTAICLMLMTGRMATSVGSTIIGLAIQSNCEETFLTVTTIVLVSGFLNFLLPWKAK